MSDTSDAVEKDVSIHPVLYFISLSNNILLTLRSPAGYNFDVRSLYPMFNGGISHFCPVSCPRFVIRYQKRIQMGRSRYNRHGIRNKRKGHSNKRVRIEQEDQVVDVNI